MSVFGPSHTLGHRLGATYGIPHGMTFSGYLYCINLSLELTAGIVSDPRDRGENVGEYCVARRQSVLTLRFFYLRRTPTGSFEGDVLLLGDSINE